MKTHFTCKSCGEADDKKTHTGARVDGKYFCEGCYWAKLESGGTEE